MSCHFNKAVVPGILFIGVIIFGARTQAQIINTVAGNGTASYAGDNGQATSAELNYPNAVCVDNAGNIYIADQSNNCVREVDFSTGVITTIAGNNSPGFSGDGAAATSAQLNGPSGVALDSKGNVYIGDNNNGRIRMVSVTTGYISTYAGGGSNPGTDGIGDGGQATGASLAAPLNLCFDDSDNLYIADHYHECVRKVTAATGIITNIAGNSTLGYSGDGGIATDAELYYPEATAVDDSGNVYIADQWNNRIRKVNQKTGIITTVAGDGNYNYSGDGGPATAAELDIVSGVATDAFGNIYIADEKNNRIREVTKATGIINTVAGNGFDQGTWNGAFSGDGGIATNAEIDQPYGLFVDACGNIYIADEDNQRIREVSTIADTVKVSPIAPVLCSGSNDTLKASGGTGTYTWSPAMGLSATMGAIVIAAPTITTTYTINGSGGCAGSTAAATVVVTVTPFVGTISVTPDTPSVCKGQTITLTANGGVGASYQWMGTTDITDSIVVKPAHDTTYELLVTSGSCSKDTFISVTVNTPPVLIVSPPSPATECNGQGIVLTVPASGSEYTWSPATGLSATTGSSVTANPTADITYTVSGIDSLGCAVTATEVISIQFGPNKPTITVSVTGDTLISSANNGNQWFVNGTAIHNATDSIFLIKGLPNNDTITVSVTDVANGCSTASGVFITGINPLAINSSRLSIYPNPTNGAITVNINASAGEVTGWSLRVTDLIGRTLYLQQLLDFKNEIDLSNLPCSVYFITVINKTGRAVFAVAKQN